MKIEQAKRELSVMTDLLAHGYGANDAANLIAKIKGEKKMLKSLNIVKSHWPAIVAFGVAFWEKFGTQIDKFVHSHPHLSVYAALVSFTVMYYIKSPSQSLPQNKSNGMFNT